MSRRRGALRLTDAREQLAEPLLVSIERFAARNALELASSENIAIVFIVTDQAALAS